MTKERLVGGLAGVAGFTETLDTTEVLLLLLLLVATELEVPHGSSVRVFGLRQP